MDYWIIRILDYWRFCLLLAPSCRSRLPSCWMIAYINNMAGKKGANLKYGEPTRNVCASIPLSLDETLRSLASQMLPRASYSATLVEVLRIGAGVLAGKGRHAVHRTPSAVFHGADGIGGGPDDASDSMGILAPSGPFHLVRLIDGNDIELPNSMRTTLADAERLRDYELVRTGVQWEIRG